MRQAIVWGLVALGLAGTASAADTDTITLRDGTQLVGEISDTSREEVTIRTGLRRQEKKVPAGEITRVEWKNEPPGLNLHRTAEQAGRLEDALKGYQDALANVGGDQSNLRADLEFLIARVKSELALGDPSQLDDAIQTLENFRKQHANSFRYYETLMLLGDLYLAKEDFSNAEAVFSLLGEASSEDYKLASQVASGRIELVRGNIPAAVQKFDGVIQAPADTPAEKSRQQQARLGKATALQRQNQNAEAAKVLDEVIEQTPPDDTGTLAEAYVRKGDTLLAAGKLKEAVLAYLHVDVLFPGEQSLHAEALYHLAELGSALGDPQLTADASGQLESKYANTEWAKKLAAPAGR